ncbi:MAG: DoxX family protein [Saprospiraceae bacterium]|nr:DoxX family protein [Saprospiraceae bacterium]
MEDKTKNRLYWIATVLSAIAFIVPGIANLIRLPHIVYDMSQLGYPLYFTTIIGGWKMLGAVVILMPKFKRLKEWAYAGMVFDLTGASLSRMFTGDQIQMIIIPLLLFVLVIISWYLRPKDRKLE